MDEPDIHPCPNCKAPFPTGTTMCPRCGWEPDKDATTWPPPVAHPDVASTARKSWLKNAGQAVLGFVGGFAATFLPSIFLFVGLIIGPVMYLQIRKPATVYTQGFLAGVIVGSIGVMPCLWGVSSFFWRISHGGNP